MNTEVKKEAEERNLLSLIYLVYTEEEVKLLLSIWKREGCKVEAMLRLHLQCAPASNLITGEAIGVYE